MANKHKLISVTGSGWFHHKLLIISGLCLISMVFESMSASFVAPSARCDFEMTSGEKGLLNAILYIGISYLIFLKQLVVCKRNTKVIRALKNKNT